jgi:6-phosphogluconate dehydrogenase
MRAAAADYKWNLNYGGIALMWRGGCIIRSAFLTDIKKAFDKNPALVNLLMNKFFTSATRRAQGAWRRTITRALKLGVPTPTMSTAIAYYDGYRRENLPANLLQAQRDYFGAHTYERIDKPAGQWFHTNWTGTGGNITASTYNA